MECKDIIRVSKIIVGSFLNLQRNKIYKICECKTMNDFGKINAYSDDLEGISILGRIITVQCYTVW